METVTLGQRDDRFMNSGACRRPIEAWKVPWLLALGTCLRELRQESGLSQALLANRAGLAERSYRRIEHGQRRTRASTLCRLADGLVNGTSESAANELLTRLLAAVGPALAEESAYRARVEARRRRRVAKENRRPVAEHTIEYMYVLGVGAVERHRHRRRVTRETTREHEYYVLRPTARVTSPRLQWTKAQWLEHFRASGHTDESQEPALRALREGSFLLSRVASGPIAHARQSERPAKNA